jgi:4-hydroxy-tetrahydrodipicolinate synthase
MFTGAITAIVTPFRDGKVDDEALAALIEEQIAAGIDGLVPVGTTGESPTVTFEEHVHIIAQTVKCVRKRIPVIAGTGSNATAEAIDLSRAARDVGADGIMQVVPYYNRPTQDGIVRHMKAVADAVPLPMIVYNVPTRTSVDMMPDAMGKLAEIPTVVGIKEATGSVLRATQVLAKVGPKIAVLSGDDFTMFPLYAVGARGVISVLSNVAPKWVAGMWDATVAGDWARARELHFRIQPLTELLFSEPSPAPTKAALALQGKIVEDVRAPLYPVTPALKERLAGALREAGLL